MSAVPEAFRGTAKRRALWATMEFLSGADPAGPVAGGATTRAASKRAAGRLRDVLEHRAADRLRAYFRGERSRVVRAAGSGGDVGAAVEAGEAALSETLRAVWRSSAESWGAWAARSMPVRKFDESQPRDEAGKWTSAGAEVRPARPFGEGGRLWSETGHTVVRVGNTKVHIGDYPMPEGESGKAADIDLAQVDQETSESGQVTPSPGADTRRALVAAVGWLKENGYTHLTAIPVHPGVRRLMLHQGARPIPRGAPDAEGREDWGGRLWLPLDRIRKDALEKYSDDQPRDESGRWVHGTSAAHVDSILREGLLASKAGLVWRNVSEPGRTYVADDPKLAMSWAMHTAAREGSTPVLLYVSIPASEAGKLEPDLEVSTGAPHTFKFRGDVKPEWITQAWVGRGGFDHTQSWPGWKHGETPELEPGKWLRVKSADASGTVYVMVLVPRGEDKVEKYNEDQPRDEAGKWTTGFHGTSSRVLDSILREGILTSHARETWLDSAIGTTYFSTSEVDAVNWGFQTSSSHRGRGGRVALLKLRIPESERSRVGPDPHISQAGGTSREFKGDIRPEWIERAWILRPVERNPRTGAPLHDYSLPPSSPGSQWDIVKSVDLVGDTLWLAVTLLFDGVRKDEAPVDAWLRQNAGKRVTEISEATRRALAKELSEAHEAGESLAQVARRIDRLYLEAIIPDRSMVIARTEVGSVANWAQHAQAVAAGVEMEKEWLALQDDRTRDDHAEADGQRVAVGVPFEVGDDLMMYPTDASYGAGPEQVINCRCSTAYHVVAPGDRKKGVEKYSDDQPRDERGRWASGAHEAAVAATPPLVRELVREFPLDWSASGGFASLTNAVRRAAAAEWGGSAPKFDWWELDVPRADWPEADRGVRAYVRALYDQTQARLRGGPETLTLYRAYSGRTNSSIQSWTDDRASAERYGDAVISAEVPRSRVLANYAGGAGDRGDREYLVVGGVVGGVRKYSPDQPRDEAGRWTDGAAAHALPPLPDHVKRPVGEFEATHRGADAEHAAAVDERGVVFLKKAGEAERVRFSRSEFDRMQQFSGVVFSHNHPNGSSFSLDDVEFARSLDLAEVRVAARGDGSYRMRPGPGGWPPYDGWESSVDPLREAYERHNDALLEELREKIVSGEVSEAEANRTHLDAVWRRVAADLPRHLLYAREG